MKIFPQLKKLQTLLSIKKKIDAKEGIIMFVPWFLVAISCLATMIAIIGAVAGIMILSINLFTQENNTAEIFVRVLLTFAASVGCFVGTYMLGNIVKKFQDKVYRKLKGERVEEKILQLVKKNKSDIVNYLEVLIAQEPEKEIYGYAVNMKSMLADNVKDNKMDKFITSFEQLYKLYELKPLNNNEEDCLEHEIGTTNNIKKYL
jgi:hypothetical protein